VKEKRSRYKCQSKGLRKSDEGGKRKEMWGGGITTSISRELGVLDREIWTLIDCDGQLASDSDKNDGSRNGKGEKSLKLFT